VDKFGQFGKNLNLVIDKQGTLYQLEEDRLYGTMAHKIGYSRRIPEAVEEIAMQKAKFGFSPTLLKAARQYVNFSDMADDEKKNFSEEITEAGKRVGAALQPDPQPDQNLLRILHLPSNHSRNCIYQSAHSDSQSGRDKTEYSDQYTNGGHDFLIGLPGDLHPAIGQLHFHNVAQHLLFSR